MTLAEGFNAAIRLQRRAKRKPPPRKRNGIEIRYYNIIYDLVDDVKKAMSGLLAPTLRETMLGNALILEVFNISKVGKVAGCRVTDGTVERGANVRLIRDNVVVHEGKLSTLKRFKDEVKEVQSGQECGMAFENYGDMRPGDVYECFAWRRSSAACSRAYSFVSNSNIAVIAGKSRTATSSRNEVTGFTTATVIRSKDVMDAD